MKYYLKLAFGLSLVISGILFAILRDDVIHNEFSILRIFLGMIIAASGFVYVMIIEGRMDRHGRC